MTDGELIYQTILDDPDSDEPRLVYADWLEETGVEANIVRSEFIRIQHQTNGARCCRWPHRKKLCQRCDICKLLSRERRLWNRRKKSRYFVCDWPNGESKFFANMVIQGCTLDEVVWRDPEQKLPVLVYQDGFPAYLRCTMGKLMDHAKELSRFPLRKVVVTDRKPIRVDSEAIEGWKQYRFMCFPSVPWRDHTPEYLPYEFRRYMIGRLGGDAIYYDNLEESNALDDLSRASLLYIRSLRQPIGVLTPCPPTT